MDYQLLSRVESHATDLFKLGQELEEAEEKLIERRESKHRRKKGPLITGELPKAALPPRQSAVPPRTKDDSVKPESPKIGFAKKSKSVPFSLSTLAENEELQEDVEDELEKREVAKRPSRYSELLTAVSMRRLPIEEQEKIHYEDLFGCFTRNFGKGFALGFGGKVLLNVFTELVSALRTLFFGGRGLSKVLSEFLAAIRARDLPWIAGSIDGAKEHGLFLGMLLALHNSIMYITRDMNNTRGRYRGSAAGFLAGLVSLVYLPFSMRRSVLLFTFVRAFELSCRILTKRDIFPKLENGDTALMSASSAFMIYTWLFHPNALDKSYVHFLQRQVQVPVTIVRAMASAQAGLPLENLTKLNEVRQSMTPKGVPFKPLTDPFGYDSPLLTTAEKAAALLHPGQSFSAFALRYYVNAIRNAIPVYVPVYAVPLVLFSSQRLIRSPVKTVSHAMMGASRSTLFLAIYCTLGIGFLSFGRRIGFRYELMGRGAKILPFLCGAVAGIATLLEKKSRRIELALYVMSKAVEGMHGVLKEKLGEHLASPPLGDSLLFATCFAVVCHANLRHPELVRDSYRTLLMRFFDTDTRHKFF